MYEKNFVGFGISLRPEVADGLQLLAMLEHKNRSQLVRELINVGLAARRQQSQTILPKATQEGSSE